MYGNWDDSITILFNESVDTLMCFRTIFTRLPSEVLYQDSSLGFDCLKFDEAVVGGYFIAGAE